MIASSSLARGVMVFGAAILVLWTAPASAAVPTSVTVEGVLTSTGGGAAADGDYDLTFSIYNVPTGGSAAWTEGPAKVAVKGGQFTHALGSAKPLTPALLHGLTSAYLTIKVGTDPELPRQKMLSVAYALSAASAASLACTDCVKTGQLGKDSVTAEKAGFAFAGSATKGGPASKAADLECTGCVSVAELKFDKDVELGGNALKAKALVAETVTANAFAGDGSKLTGIKIPSGTCKVSGEVVKGINADGTLQCVKAMDPAALPGDGIDEISNGLIHNQFVDSFSAGPVDIPDNNPTGVSSEITVADVGLAQKLTVFVEMTNSDMKTVEVIMYDPNNAKYVLYSKAGAGAGLKTSYPEPTKPVSGNLLTWVGKNPKGKWRLHVADTGFKDNKIDGKIVKWTVALQTLSNKKVQIKGNLIMASGLQLGTDASACTAVNAGTIRYANGKPEYCNGTVWKDMTAPAVAPAMYRWTVFSTYANNHGNWFMGNNAAVYGGINPQKWTDANACAYQISSVREVQRSMFTKKGYGGYNANVWAEEWKSYSSTNSHKAGALFRIKNNTNSAITWKPYAYMTAWVDEDRASVSLNGANTWCPGSNYYANSGHSWSLSIPANRTSTVIFISGSTPQWNDLRACILAFYNNSLKLPAGLEFVDDLDTAKDGWNN